MHAKKLKKKGLRHHSLALGRRIQQERYLEDHHEGTVLSCQPGVEMAIKQQDQLPHITPKYLHHLMKTGETFPKYEI